MDKLTDRELKVFNNLSRVLNPNVLLGDKIAELIDTITTTGTPVNAVNATATLAVSGVVIHGETVAIHNPKIINRDLYEFLADDAQTTSTPDAIGVDITAYANKAVGTLTIDTQPTSGDKMTIGEKEYTFVPVGTDTADGEISIGIDLATAQAAIVAAINGDDAVNVAHPLVVAGDFADDDCIISALIGGTAGNAIDTISEFTAETNEFAAITLLTGSDCSAANAITALVTAIEDFDTQGVGAVDGTGDTVVLTADTAGHDGNYIAIDTNMENGSFRDAADFLSGGVNGTIGSTHKMVIGTTYLYVCIADNTVSGKNWRRISLGSTY